MLGAAIGTGATLLALAGAIILDAALLALGTTFDAIPGFFGLGTDSGAALCTALCTTLGTALCTALCTAILGAALCTALTGALDAARNTRGADIGSIDSGIVDRGRAAGTTLCNAGAGATLGNAALALLALTGAAIGSLSLCNSSCTIDDDAALALALGAIPGFLSFFGGSCDNNGGSFIGGAIPGFFSLIGAALTAALAEALAAGAIPGFGSFFGAAIACSCARRGRD
jgi:hypothetical protein